jgi:segregation and condensation protein B
VVIVSADDEKKEEKPIKTAKVMAKPDPKDPEKAVEAALFSAGRPIAIEELCTITNLPHGPVRRAVKRLIKKYRSEKTTLEVSRVGSRYAMQLKTGYAEDAVKVAPCEIPKRFLKTLALIAYHQPIKQSELKGMIGDKVYEHVPELQKYGMVHAKKFGPTKILMTSNRFPEYFGIETSTREGIKEWIANKFGLKVVKSKIPLKQFENIEEDMKKEAEAAQAGSLPSDAQNEPKGDEPDDEVEEE